MEDPVVPLERNLYGLLWQTAVEKPKFRREIETVYFVETKGCHQLLDIAGELLEFVRRIHACHTTNCPDA